MDKKEHELLSKQLRDSHEAYNISLNDIVRKEREINKMNLEISRLSAQIDGIKAEKRKEEQLLLLDKADSERYKEQLEKIKDKIFEGMLNNG